MNNCRSPAIEFCMMNSECDVMGLTKYGFERSPTLCVYIAYANLSIGKVDKLYTAVWKGRVLFSRANGEFVKMWRLDYRQRLDRSNIMTDISREVVLFSSKVRVFRLYAFGFVVCFYSWCKKTWGVMLFFTEIFRIR